jgi:hypothetical protein
MPSVDLDAPEHAICSRVIADRDARIAELNAGLARVTRKFALLHNAVGALLDEGDDGTHWDDFPKRLTEEQRERLCAAYNDEAPGSRWVTPSERPDGEKL